MLTSFVSASSDGVGAKRAQQRPPVKPTAPRTRVATSQPEHNSYATAIWNCLWPKGLSRTPSIEETTQSILLLGPQAAPTVLDVLLGRAEPPIDLAAHRVQRAAEPDSSQFLSRQDQVLLAVIAASPSRIILPAVERYAGESKPSGGEVMMLRAIGRIRDSRSLDVWISVAARIEPAALESGETRRVAADSLGSILRASPDGCRRLREIVQGLRPQVIELVALALSDRDDSAALSVLVRVLGRSGSLDGEVLRAIANAALSVRTPSAETELTRVRSYVDSPDDRMRADACTALGALTDASAASKIIERLNDEQSIVRSAATGALRRMAKSRIGDDAAAWRAWLDQEESWHDKRWPELRVMLASSDSARVVESVKQLGAHPLYRHELALNVSPLCNDLRADVAKSACSAVSALDSLAAGKHLIDALDAPTAEVEMAAWSALKKISGRVLPPTTGAWRAALDQK